MKTRTIEEIQIEVSNWTKEQIDDFFEKHRDLIHKTNLDDVNRMIIVSTLVNLAD